MPWRHMIFPGMGMPLPLQPQFVDEKAQEHELALPKAIEQLKPSKAATFAELCFREDADDAISCSSG